MPRLSAWSVRLAMLYLLLGFTFGALMLANKGIPFADWLWRLLPAHMDILLFGFVIQLAIGFAFWILPRYRGGSRGNENVVWVAVVLLNLGIWTITIAGSFNFSGLWMVTGRVLEGVAAILFVFQIWKRIRPS
jgi:hypothetical protein